MSSADWSLVSLLSSSIGQCKSIEFMPLTSTDEYIVYCHCEETVYLCLNLLEIKSVVHTCYLLMFSKNRQEQHHQLNVITRVLLCYVTECLTSWNIRRRLVLMGNINVKDELDFLEILHNIRPKSEQLFRYRRWLLKQENIHSITLDKELNISERAAEKHFINYASWSHRRWLINYFNANIDDELRRNQSWLEKHLSDSSGFSYRAYLLSKTNLNPDLFEQELDANENLLKFYFDRESLWIYRQTLILLIMKQTSVDIKSLITKEIDLMKTFQDKNFFSNRYTQLLNVLLVSDGQLFRN